MGNYLSRCNDKSFSTRCCWKPVTSGRLKKAASGIQKEPVKFFAAGVHRNPMTEYLGLLKKASLLDIYHRFPPQSC